MSSLQRNHITYDLHSTAQISQENPRYISRCCIQALIWRKKSTLMVDQHLAESVRGTFWCLKVHLGRCCAAFHCRSWSLHCSVLGQEQNCQQLSKNALIIGYCIPQNTHICDTSCYRPFCLRRAAVLWAKAKGNSGSEVPWPNKIFTALLLSGTCHHQSNRSQILSTYPDY